MRTPSKGLTSAQSAKLNAAYPGAKIFYAGPGCAYTTRDLAVTAANAASGGGLVICSWGVSTAGSVTRDSDVTVTSLDDMISVRTGDSVTLIDAQAADAEADPTIASGIDCTGYEWVRLVITMTGTTAGWTLTPLYADTGDATYTEGDPIAVSTAEGNITVSIPSQSVVDFNLRADTSYGTTPVISVVATPYRS